MLRCISNLLGVLDLEQLLIVPKLSSLVVPLAPRHQMLKKAIQSLIDNKRIQLEDLGYATNIDQNPLPTQNGVNMVETMDIKVFMEDSNRSIIYVKAAEPSHEPLLSNTIPVMVTRAVQATGQDDNPVLLVKNIDNKMVGLSHSQSNVTSPKRNKDHLKEIDVAKEEHTMLADLRQVF